ncbi:MAG TPA: FkbM family methyltransferase [Pirellulaceae bacterium]|nr:FkbM family methyltransferase [Pirellulaceae bacterium]
MLESNADLNDSQILGLLESLPGDDETAQRTIFDIGANHGQSVSSFLRRFPSATIHAFEPNPAAYHQLLQNYGELPNVHCHRLALGDACGPTKFHSTRLSEVASLLRPAPVLVERSGSDKYDFEMISVEMATLDKFCEKHAVAHIDLCKIDVQGAESRVLSGARSMLQNHRIALIYMEATFSETYEGQSDFRRVYNLLSDMQYVLWDFMPRQYVQCGRIWYADVIFASQSSFHLIDAAHRDQPNSN